MDSAIEKLAPGPFEVVEDQSSAADASGSVLDDSAAEPILRLHDCAHYETCLDLAASLNWNSFTCNRCSGEVNNALLWRAHQHQRKDSVAKALCDLKPIEKLTGSKG